MRGYLLAAAFVLAGCTTPASAPAAPDPMHMDEPTFRQGLAERFQHGPPQPPPAEVADQRAGQIADAAYLQRFPEFDRSYTPRTRAQAQRLLVDLREHAGELSHEQFVLRVAEIAALADNGHTALRDLAFKKNTPRLPLRTYPFADGHYVLWATPANRNLLGARIDTIDGHSIADINVRIRRYYGGTDAHRRAMLLPMLESPALLQAAGLANEHDALTLSGVLANGQPFTQRITAEQRDRAAWVSNSARLLLPARPDGPMVSFFADGAGLPVSLHDRAHLFTSEALPDGGFYIGLAHNADADEGPIAGFLEGALTRIRSEHPAFVVLDMRMNGGGDYTTTYAFARALPEAAGAAHIYVLTSAWTFSAAITTVGALKQAGGDRVSIVGEPVGDRLDFWAEGDSFQLPNEFLVVHYSSGRHVYNGPCADTTTCFWLNYLYPVRVRSLAPDISAPWTFAAYRDGRDPAIEAVLAREVTSGSGARRP